MGSVDPHFNKRGILTATDPMKSGEAPKEHEQGRICPVCGTALSKYNEGPGCYAHRDMIEEKPKKRSGHGTENMYVLKLCRCDMCVDAHRAYRRKLSKKRREKAA